MGFKLPSPGAIKQDREIFDWLLRVKDDPQASSEMKEKAAELRKALMPVPPQRGIHRVPSGDRPENEAFLGGAEFGDLHGFADEPSARRHGVEPEAVILDEFPTEIAENLASQADRDGEVEDDLEGCFQSDLQQEAEHRLRRWRRVHRAMRYALAVAGVATA